MYNLFSICSGVFTTQSDWATQKFIFISTIHDHSSKTVARKHWYLHFYSEYPLSLTLSPAKTLNLLKLGRITYSL